MSTSGNGKRHESEDNRRASDIERDLASTRADLGDTLEELGERLDVKTRATQWVKETADGARQQAKQLVDKRARELGIASGALVVATVTFLIRRAQRR